MTRAKPPAPASSKRTMLGSGPNMEAMNSATGAAVRNCPSSSRRLLEVGKGNGKSPTAGGIGLYTLLADGEAGAEVYAAATTRDQARILFRDAVHMVDASPALTRRIQRSGIREVLNLAHLSSGSFFRPVSSEGRALDGKRPYCVLILESPQ